MGALHDGELAVQARVGVRDAVAGMAERMLRPYLTDQLRAFFPTLPFVVAAARDADGRPWATLLCGEPGFAATPDASSLALAARPVPGDALEHAFGPGARVGLLGIELETRRRNRVNGTVRRSGRAGRDGGGREDDRFEGRDSEAPGAIVLDVDQAFGNCPQYISTRRREAAPFEPAGARAERSERLDARARATITAADTLFVASGYPDDGSSDAAVPSDAPRAAGMDASHRGGAPGFVEVVDERRLVLPDYAGNRLFNTLGNLELDPRIGLTFVDFERGALLQLTGTARVEWSPEPSTRHSGAQRLVHVELTGLVRLERALPRRWSGTEGARRELIVAAHEPASEDVAALVLTPRDGEPIGFVAGQHLSVELPSGEARGLARTYSLAGDPADAARVRIGVRRDPRGAVSRALHALGVGDTVLAGSPSGDFRAPRGMGAAALIGAGVGVTPLVAMAHALAESERPVRVLQVARDGAHAPFAAELRALADAHAALSCTTVFTRPRRVDRLGHDHDHVGRPDAAFVADWLPVVDVDVRLCGPPAFVENMTALLAAAGVDEGGIEAETF